MASSTRGAFVTLFAAGLLGAVLGHPAHAASFTPLTLQDLIGGETFSSRNGLVFSDFEAELDLPDRIDAGDIRVFATRDGFLLVGPFRFLGMESGGINLS